MTAAKTGYTTQQQTFTGGSAAIVVVNVGMSTGNVNPTIQPTSTTTFVGPTPAANGLFTGFFAPVENGAVSAGANPSEVGIIMAVLFVFAGAVIGGWSARPFDPVSSFNMSASFFGAGVGFIFAIVFGFIGIVWVIVIFGLGLLWLLIVNR
jgi:hypothetical protein